MTTHRIPDVPIERIDVAVYRIPTDAPESDGTLNWDATTMVLVEAAAGDRVGLGYSYTSSAAAELIRRELAPVVVGRDALAVPAAWQAQLHAIRNLGRPGLAATAIAAVDAALWDLRESLS